MNFTSDLLYYVIFLDTLLSVYVYSTLETATIQYNTMSVHSLIFPSVQERNEAFYKDESGKTMVMYPKELVYPPSGGEYSLEEIRARLPQYQVDFDNCEDIGMELTCVPQIPPVYKSSDVKKVGENVRSVCV